MKITKFTDFLNEDVTETPSNMTSGALYQLKKKIDKLFLFQENEYGDEINPKKSNVVFEPLPEIGIRKKKSNKKLTFQDLGVRLESSEVSKYSKMHDSLVIKFSDDNFTYTLIISIDIKEGMPKAEKKPMMCDIKFKKYDLDTFEVIGQIPSHFDGDPSGYLKIEINKIDEEYLIDLKIKLDDTTDEEYQDFEIQTE